MLLLLVVSATAQVAVKNAAVDLPCLPSRNLSSPDKQWTLFSRNYRLLVQNNKTQDRQFLRVRGGELGCGAIQENSCAAVQVEWSPDSSLFFLNDEQASDRTECYVVSPGTGQAMNVAELLRSGDPESIRWIRVGHSYIYAQRWLSPKELLVNVAGHFDGPAAKMFEVQYRVNLVSRSVARMSAREYDPEEYPQQAVSK
jgi:hypothetical protein